jgi:hypothetical protein
MRDPPLPSTPRRAGPPVLLLALVSLMIAVGLFAVLAAHIAPTTAPTVMQATGPTVEPALIGRWEGQGATTQLPQFSAAGGTYQIAWGVHAVQARRGDPPWRFTINLLDNDFPHSQLGLGPKDLLGVVDFTPLPGQEPPFTETVMLSSVSAGRYYMEVDTCQLCVWQVSVWQRDAL